MSDHIHGIECPVCAGTGEAPEVAGAIESGTVDENADTDADGHQRIAVDFDNTLTTTNSGTYFTDHPPEPHEPMIEWVNEQYRQGNTIIIWTARPWSVAGKTAGRLAQWGVRYHGLICEKGSADRYVDDKAERPEEVLGE